MINNDRTIEQILLDHALGKLTPEEAVQIQQRIDAEPEMKKKYDRVLSILEPLDTWTAPPPPENLVGSILDRVENTRFPRLVNSDSDEGFHGMTPPPESAMPPRTGVSLREVLAVAACVALFFGVMFPSVARNRSVAQRNQCNSQLAGLFTGLSAYSQDNNQSWPNAGMLPGDNWLENSPNRKNLVILVKLQYLPDGSILICPGSASDSSESLDVRKRCSFDMQNMAGPVPNSIAPVKTPIVSDANPLFSGGKFHSELDPFHANSGAHDGRGQNLLYMDGHVGWTTSPETADGDNIWTTGNIRQYKGTEVQSSASDAFLVP